MLQNPVRIPRSEIGELALLAQSAGIFAKGEYPGKLQTSRRGSVTLRVEESTGLFSVPSCRFATRSKSFGALVFYRTLQCSQRSTFFFSGLSGAATPNLRIDSATLLQNPVRIPCSEIGELALQAQSAGIFAKGEYPGQLQTSRRSSVTIAGKHHAVVLFAQRVLAFIASAL